jgi:hypothetical protein
LKISLLGFKKAKRPEAFRFEPLNQTQYYYGRTWCGVTVTPTEQVTCGMAPTVPTV